MDRLSPERLDESTRLGSYQIIRRLARGGMAELFLAHGPDRLVVLKKILPKYADNPRFVQLFLDEARLAASLAHPNIVQVYDAGGDGRNFFFAMEYLHGQDMRSILHRSWTIGEKVPIEHAVHVASHVAAALHYAHERCRPDGTLLGVVHRDVSPSNIIVTYDGAVKLVDFGVAKAATSSVKTRTGTLKGKISYMSPEQAKGASVDRRSDLFSLGIVLWEMVTTQRLFRGENDLQTLQLIINEPPKRPSEVQPACPPELERVILRALAQDPAARYQTAAELLGDLGGLALEAAPEALSAYVARVFSPEVGSWQAARAAGVQLAAHLTSGGDLTTPLTESDFVEAIDLNAMIQEEEEEEDEDDEELTEIPARPPSPPPGFASGAIGGAAAPEVRRSTPTPPPVPVVRTHAPSGPVPVVRAHTPSGSVPVARTHAPSGPVPVVRAHTPSGPVPVAQAHAPSGPVPAPRAHTPSGPVPAPRAHTASEPYPVTRAHTPSGPLPVVRTRAPSVPIATAAALGGPVAVRLRTASQGVPVVPPSSPPSPSSPSSSELPVVPSSGPWPLASGSTPSTASGAFPASAELMALPGALDPQVADRLLRRGLWVGAGILGLVVIIAIAIAMSGGSPPAPRALPAEEADRAEPVPVPEPAPAPVLAPPPDGAVEPGATVEDAGVVLDGGGEGTAPVAAPPPAPPPAGKKRRPSAPAPKKKRFDPNSPIPP